MADKKILLRIPVMALVFGMFIVGCAQLKDIEKKVDDGQAANRTSFNNVKTETNNLQKKTDDLQEKTDDLHDKVDELNDKVDMLLAPRPLPVYAENARMVPVSMEIIERARVEKIDLSKLEYRLSANITVYINDSDDKLELRGGKLVETKINLYEQIPITIENPGEKVGGGRDFFDISFGDENVVLRFERNTIRNRFDLVAAKKRGKLYFLNFEKEKPYLVINYPYIPNNESIQVQGIGVSLGGDDGGKHRLLDTETITERIEGWGTLNPTVIVQFIQEQNRNYTRNFLEDFIGTYFGEARALGINPDLAIAQMCYVTNFLRNEKAMSTRNYAGFSTMPAGGRFRNREEGIQAHIQHLKGYADERYWPSHIVDPRWNNLDNVRGTVDTLDGLARIWAPNNRYYAAAIANIIHNMRYFAQGRA